MTGKLLLFLIILLIVLAIIVPGCSTRTASSGKIGVAVSILPQSEFARAVGGDKVDILVMVPPGADPHTYEVTPNQIIKLANAKLYCKVGSPIEFELTWMEKIQSINKGMIVTDCSKGIELIKSQDPDEPGMDPHIWMSIKNAAIMVQNICAGLSQVDPTNQAFYEKNRDLYLEKLTILDKDITSSLANSRNRSFIIFHPALGYFCRDYSLTQIAIEQEGKEPTAEYITRIISEAKSRNIKVVFISPQHDARSAEVIAKEIGGKVGTIDSLSEKYVDNISIIKTTLQQAMQ
jgi:zinc transport system substrate-binding protein